MSRYSEEETNEKKQYLSYEIKIYVFEIRGVRSALLRRENSRAA